VGTQPLKQSGHQIWERAALLGYFRYVYTKRGQIAVSISYYLFLVTFLAAYINPSHSITVTIDAYNEAEVELALILLSLPAAAGFLLDGLRNTTRKKPRKTQIQITHAREEHR
jgi:hypothetical protein